VGIGSLLVQENVDGEAVQGNMMVPIDLLEPILGDLVAMGRADRPARPWLGMYTTEANGQLVVAGLAKGGPADAAGVRTGDLVLEVAGERLSGLADLFRKVWRIGPAGAEIPLTLARGTSPVSVRIRSADRADFLKKPQLH
jgi:S1-C subfamily serine protease